MNDHELVIVRYELIISQISPKIETFQMVINRYGDKQESLIHQLECDFCPKKEGRLNKIKSL